ncbi:MAG TPA: mechanosensitive ion channel domain-containing protein [Xanthobacteraceae bacterium]|nr:mechanosensitive ion channel domain-containing protein [Xanthobacteraceae bacterium]
MDGIQATWSRIGEVFAWLPAWGAGMVVLVLTVAVALVAHAILLRLVRAALGPRHVFLQSLLAQTRDPTRLALIILALAAALPAARLDAAAADDVRHALLIGFIVLVGWFAIIAVNVFSRIYLLRFHVDVEDNLLARKHLTQVGILSRAVIILIVVLTAAFALTTFESVRQYGVSLFASAGVAGLVAGLAARPVLSNLIAGVQIAMTQPIRLEDAVIVENEYGWIEEITSTYVVIRLWDWRRMVVPLSYFIEKPFQNWTRQTASLIGSVLIHVDYTVPVGRVREKLSEIVSQSKLWDCQVVNLQVTDAKEGTIELRALVSAASAPAAWDLRCEVREKLIAFLQQEFPRALPRRRTEVTLTDAARAELQPGPRGGIAELAAERSRRS